MKKYTHSEVLKVNKKEFKFVMEKAFDKRPKGTIRFLSGFKRDERIKELNAKHPQLLGLDAFIELGIPIIATDKPQSYYHGGQRKK